MSCSLLGVLGRAVVLAVVLAGCATAQAPEPVGTVPGRGAAYPMREPTPEIEGAAARFAGSCAFAKPPEELAGYDKVVVSMAETAVFASAELRGSSNRIGLLHGQVVARASGPVASAHDSAPGFALLLIDTEGRVCRGYVAASDVRRQP